MEIQRLSPDRKQKQRTRQTRLTIQKNARQKQHFRLKTSRHPRFIANFHPDSTIGLLATSQSLENNRRRYPRGNKGRIKSAALPYPLMNAKDVESPVKTLPTHQKHSRTAHLQLKSTVRPRVSPDILSAATKILFLSELLTVADRPRS